MSDGSEALGQLVDKAEITDRLHAYCRWVDHNQPEEQVMMFTDDCRVTYGGGRWLEGRDTLLTGLRAALARYESTCHHLSNIEITFTGADTADVESAVLAWHRHRDDSPDFILHARYCDKWVRTADGWRATTRELRINGFEGRGDNAVNSDDRFERRS